VKLPDSVARILRQKGSEVYCVAPQSSVYDALEQMAEKDIGAVAVMRGAELVGLMSERDYARKVALKGQSSRILTVEDVMSPPVVVAPDTSIDECMRLITDERCRYLAVAENGQLLGLVSIGDVVNWIISVQDLAIHQLEDYITGRYPA
jgi:CBS domain-containing protein